MDKLTTHPPSTPDDLLPPVNPLADAGEEEENDTYEELWLPARASCKTFEYVLAVLLFAVFALNFINVIGRRATDFTPAWFEGVARFFSSLGWIDEASRFIIIWVGFIGAALVYAANKHVALTIVVDRLPNKPAQIFRALAITVVAAVFGIYFWYGIIVAQYSINRSSALDIPMWWVYLCVPVAALFGLFFAIEKLIKHLRSRP